MSLHGDADLYVSKSDPFPMGDEANDKSSKKSKSTVDRIDFDNNSALGGDYFIGVKGFHQDSSFELQVKR